MTPPNTIKLSTTAIFSIAVVMLGYHLSAIFGFSLPLDLAGPQGSFEDSVISIVVNVLLLLTVGLRVGATMALSYQRALNVFIVIFILLFTLMTLQSLQSGAWFLLAAALVNLAALFRLLFYKRIPSENLGILSMQTDSNADQRSNFWQKMPKKLALSPPTVDFNTASLPLVAVIYPPPTALSKCTMLGVCWTALSLIAQLIVGCRHNLA